MDFQSLTRKELQTLCKKNKIPANLTNVAMADALQALQHVEGLEEFLNQSKSDAQQFPEDAVIGSPDVPRTSCKTSAKRKPIKEEPESLQPMTRTRRGARRGVAEEQQERNEIPNTPAAPSTHRRAQQKMEARKDESSVQRVYSTRRSVRLLEKTMEKMTLTEDNRNIQPLKIGEFTEEMADGSSEKGAEMQTLSVECSEKTEESSEFKSNESPEVQIELENDVQEGTKSHVHEISEANEERSGEIPEDLVEKSDETMDVKTDTIDEKELGDAPVTEFSYEAQDSHKDLDANQNLATDSLVAEIPDEVSTEVESSVRTEENNDFSVVKQSGEAVPLNLSASSVQTENLEEEAEQVVIKNLDEVDHDEGSHDSKLESTIESEPQSSLILSLSDGHTDVLASNGSEIHVAEDNFEGKFDFESDSMSAEEESDNDFSEEEEESGDDSISSDKKVKVDVYQVIESGDDSSEEESEDSEASDEEVSSQNSEDISDDEVESEETDSEASLVDVNVIEGEVAITNQAPLISVEQESSCAMVSGGEVQFSTLEKGTRHLDEAAMEKFSSSGTLVDVCVSEEESNKTTDEILPSGSKVSTKSPLSPFASDQLAGQFPRPTLPTPGKSSSKAHPVIQKISEIFDENEENIKEGDRTAALTEEDKVKQSENITDDNNKQKLYMEKSLRQLQKMLRDQLQIENNKMNNKQVDKSRIALQTLPENRMTVDETQKEN